MKLAGMGIALVIVCTLAGCKQVTDSEARKYYSDDLPRHLDSLVYQLCEVKASAATGAPGRLLCPATGPRPKAPRFRDTPGSTASAASQAPEGKDKTARKYIRNTLEPYLDSLTYQLCHIKSRAAPAAPGRVICPGPPEGYKKPPANGDP
jgi:hypothetical protein